MPRLSAARDPYSLPGRILSDGQTSNKPAGRVLLSDPALVRALGCAGLWDEEARRVDYDTPLPEGAAPIADVETAIIALVAAVQRLERERAVHTMLLRSIMHGAIAEGLRLSTIRGQRQFYLSGGSAILFDKDTESGGFSVNRYTIPVLNPLKFYVAAGGLLIEERRVDTLPGVCAAEADGETEAWPKGTYRADCLALIPKGEDPTPEWYLFLGRPSTIRDPELAGEVPTPQIPASLVGEVLPLYRIVSRQDQKGITSVEQIANRVGGL